MAAEVTGTMAMQPEQWPLPKSIAVLNACAEWAGPLRPRLVTIIESREPPEPHHRVVAAASLLRLHSLCRALVFLLEGQLPDEAATLTRVLTEAAIRGMWVGADDQRALALQKDLLCAHVRDSGLQEQYLGISQPLDSPAEALLSHDMFRGVSGLPPLRNMADEVKGQASALYAGLYGPMSQPTHNPIWGLEQLVDPEKQKIWLDGVAACAVQAATMLADAAVTRLGSADDRERLRVVLAQRERLVLPRRPR